MKNLFLSTVVGLSLVSPVLAQEAFDVQQAMEQVRKENLQRIGVERKQQIVSTLRKRAEDLAAISAAGFKVTSDGSLEPIDAPPVPELRTGSNRSFEGAAPNGGDGTAGFFSDGRGSDIGADGGIPAWLKENSVLPSDETADRMESDVKLKAILANRAVLSVNGSDKRYKEGDELPGGLVLVAINSRSVDVKGRDAKIETLYMDWSSASNRAPSSFGSQGRVSESGTFMQSGQPVEGFGVGL